MCGYVCYHDNSKWRAPMSGAADFKVGCKTGFASGASEKKMYPHFSKCGYKQANSKQIRYLDISTN